MAASAKIQPRRRNYERRIVDRLRGKAVDAEAVVPVDPAERSHLLLREFEESGKGWFWEADRDGNLTYASDALGRALGSSSEELIGCFLGDLLTDEDLSGHRSLMFHLTHALSFTDMTVKPRALKDTWWSISGRAVRGESGVIISFRGFGTDLTEQRLAEAEVARLAHYDGLTGLPNRTMMRRVLAKALDEESQKTSGVSVLLIDLDRFKQVNDTFGHAAGDALLHSVSQRLQKTITEAGEVGRLGGDEFMAVLPGLTDRSSLSELTAKLVEAIVKPHVIEGQRVDVGVSIGVATAFEDSTCLDAVIRDADLALYAAKSSTIQPVRFFSTEMHEQAHERQLLESELRSALTDHGLALMYQPIVDTGTEKLIGFEALLRWAHPTRGEVSPDRFVQLAEETGLIMPIGEWVLRTACEEAASWPDHVRLAVNLSPVQFQDASLPSLVMNALASSQVAPQRLELEVTEGVFLSASAATEEIFAMLKSMGTRLAVDDFGTGYSSLGYLRTAPFDKIKIDRSFVRGATQKGSRNAAIMRAIVSLAESLGMETTAEGVETHDELALVKELGCSQVQGFLFGKPMTAEAAAKLVGNVDRVEATGFKCYRAPRHRVFRSGLLHIAGGKARVRVRNISSGGALIETDESLQPDAEIRLELPGIGLLPGFICWSTEGKAGLRFVREVEPKAILNGTRWAAAPRVRKAAAGA